MNKEENIVLRLIYFCSFTIYGFVPTLHWVWINGFYSDEVKIFLPRIFIFYLFCGAAFMFYIAKFPERCLPGKLIFSEALISGGMLSFGRDSHTGITRATFLQNID